MHYHIVHLGCQMNISDAERIRQVLDSAGYTEIDSEEKADLLGIVACSVRQKAIDKVYSMISKWNKWKKDKNIITFITGCVLDDDREKFLDRFDLVFPVEEITGFGSMLNDYGVVTKHSLSSGDIHSFWNVNPKYTSDFQAFIPIQNGCDKFCSYCAVPYTRGREVSRSSDEIIAELRNLVKKGYKSITLLGQNVNSYGLDKKGEEIIFAELLEKIGKTGEQFSQKFWVYFTSPHPKDMSSEILVIINRYDCLAEWIHLPLQSGDNEILKKMNRNHDMTRFAGTVENIRKIIPDSTLFTDIIVGFPGETASHFENTRLAFKKFGFNMAYIAIYSPRPGAASSKWDDNIEIDEKKKRFQLLSADLMSISLAINRDLIGNTVTVLVEGADRKPGYLTSKTEGRLIIRFKGNSSLAGNFAKVKITSASPLSMEGEFISLEDNNE